MLHKLDKTPNFIVGDKVGYFNEDWHVNPESKYFVVEACEYKRQFLDRAPHPFISVITNIDLDHTDYYKDQEDYNSAFIEFLKHTKQTIVIDGEQENEGKVIKQISQRNIIDVCKYRKQAYELKSPLVGNHNKENILRAFCTAIVLGYNQDQIKDVFVDFPGVAKRMEYKGISKHGNSIYLDYAHNPAKVRACIEGVKEQFPNKKLIFVFQPHSHERTYTFKKEFADSVKKANYVLIPNIFKPTREEEKHVKLITAQQFVEFLKRENKITKIFHTIDFVKTVNKIIEIEEKESECVIVLASAGDLYKICEEL